MKWPKSEKKLEFGSRWVWRTRIRPPSQNCVAAPLNKYLCKQGLNWCVNSLHVSELERPWSCSCLEVTYVYLGSLFIDLQVVSRYLELLSATIIAHKLHFRESRKNGLLSASVSDRKAVQWRGNVRFFALCLQILHRSYNASTMQCLILGW